MKNAMKKIKTIMILAIIAMIVSCSNSSSGSEEKSNDKENGKTTREKLIQQCNNYIQELEKYNYVPTYNNGDMPVATLSYNETYWLYRDIIKTYKSYDLQTKTVEELEDIKQKLENDLNFIEKDYQALPSRDKKFAK